jgi:AcrR family transcriptional regulator
MDTRTAILEKNFEAIHKSGFQAVRTDKVVADLGITKGAFYHYFPDKLAMGYAIVEEIIYPMFVGLWQKTLAQVLENQVNSVESIANAVNQIKAQANKDNISLGCPLNNLVQEMSSIDEVFRKKLSAILNKELELIQQIIQQGIDKQEIKASIDVYGTACFILAGIEGSYTLGKSKNSLEAFLASMDSLFFFLECLENKTHS